MVIGMGLVMVVNWFKDSDSKSKVVIFLIDGVNNIGYQFLMLVVKIVKEYNIKVYIIGVGSVGEIWVLVSRRSDGKYVLGLVRVEIDEDLFC